jgi:hypothetical protein
MDDQQRKHSPELRHESRGGAIESAELDRTSQEEGSDRTASSEPLRPTIQTYGELEIAFDFLNTALFEGIFGARLPNVMLTVPRSKRFQSHFAPRSWVSGEAGQRTSEIALNPYFFSNAIEVLQTLTHEMVHLAQAELPEVYGSAGKGSHYGYHGKKFAAVMIRLGLMPSSTGLPGGSMTGFRMGEFIIGGGPFEQAARWFLEHGNKVSWTAVPNFDAAGPGAQGSPSGGGAPGASAADRKRKSKTRFTCPKCELNAWAKATAHLECGVCRVRMTSDAKAGTAVVAV